MDKFYFSTSMHAKNFLILNGAMIWELINQKRLQVFDRDFQIVSRCLETSVKHDARVFDVASKTIHTSLVIRSIVSVL